MTERSRSRLSPVRLATSFIGQSLRVRMTVAFGVAGGLTVLLVSGVSYERARRALRSVVTERLTGVANRRAVDVSRWITQQSDLVRFIAGIPSMTDGVPLLVSGRAATNGPDPVVQRRVTAVLDSARRAGVAVSELTVMSARGGRVLASTNPGEVGTYHVDDLYFREGLRGPFTQNFYPSHHLGRPTMTAAAPVRSPDGTVVAVLAAHLDLRQIEDIVEQKSGRMPIEVYLVDRFSDPVSADRFRRVDVRRGLHSLGIDSALSGHDGSGFYLNYAGVPVIGIYRWIPERELALIVESPQAAAFAPARNLLAVILSIGIGAVALMAVVAHRIAGHVASPILSLARSAERVAQGDLDVRATVATGDEVGFLAVSFNQMTHRLRKLVEDLNGQVAATTAALDALCENQALVQGIVDNSAMLVAVIDFDGQFVLVNRHFESLFARRREDILGRAVVEVLSERDAESLRQTVSAVHNGGEVAESEIIVSTPDGDRTFLSVSFPLRHADGAAYAVGIVASDITERQRAEAERRRLELQMQHAQKLESLGVLAGGVAHDFNNLLAAVHVNAELALAEAPGHVRQSIQQILVATRRASELTRQMLAYAGKASLERRTVDLNESVRDLLELAKATFSKKVELRMDMSPQPMWVLADSAQISQVVLNLLTNAAEAIGDRVGTVTIGTALVPHDQNGAVGDASRATTDVRFTVSDTGKGMSEETQRRIFEPFYTTKASGRGLGLAAVLGIVKSAGGRLSVSSAEGQGSTFEILLPSAEAPIEAGRGPISDPAMGAATGCVLVVDDEPMLRAVANRVLSRMGYEVIEAADGVEGLRLFKQNRERVSAVVLDMTMPGMDGAEVLRQIRQCDADVAVIVVSGYDARNTAVARSLDPAVEFLQKPFGVDDLVAAVTRGARVRA